MKNKNNLVLASFGGGSQSMPSDILNVNVSLIYREGSFNILNNLNTFNSRNGGEW